MELLLAIISIIEFVMLMRIADRKRKTGIGGTMTVVETDTKKTFVLDSSDVDPSDLDGKKQLVFKIVNSPE